MHVCYYGFFTYISIILLTRAHLEALVNMKSTEQIHHPEQKPGVRGRYLCAGRTLYRGEVCCILARLFPEYPVPTRCKEGAGKMENWCRFSSRRIKELGVCITRLRQGRYDTVPSLRTRASYPIVTMLIYAESLRRIHLELLHCVSVRLR